MCCYRTITHIGEVTVSMLLVRPHHVVMGYFPVTARPVVFYSFHNVSH